MKPQPLILLTLLWVCTVCAVSVQAANPADIYPDNKVDWLDIMILADDWLFDGNTPADIDNSGDVNGVDFAILANNWGWTLQLPEMVPISGGEFLMGDHHGDDYSSEELPVHLVYIDSFYMSKFEITNQQYCDYLNSAYDVCDIKVDDGIVYASSDSTNSYPYCDTYSSDIESSIDYLGGTFSVIYKRDWDMTLHPMVEVTWYGAAAYCNWASQQEYKEQCYNPTTWSCDFTKNGYRLPTEAEWEYAARGGEQHPYYRFPLGDTISHSQANYFSYWIGGSPYYPYDGSLTEGYSYPHHGTYPYTCIVGKYSANGFGLHDMEGNVNEWCNDWYSPTYYSSSPYNNPTGPTTGTTVVVRGGCWKFAANVGRVACRHSYLSAYPGGRVSWGGFRVVQDLE